MRNTSGLKPFKPGQSGNPGGKPAGARNELSAAFLKAVIKDFDQNGADAISKLRTESPVKYCELIAGLLPSEANVSVKSDHTVTHIAEPVSATAGWVSEALRERADREVSKSLPN